MKMRPSEVCALLDFLAREVSLHMEPEEFDKARELGDAIIDVLGEKAQDIPVTSIVFTLAGLSSVMLADAVEAVGKEPPNAN